MENSKEISELGIYDSIDFNPANDPMLSKARLLIQSLNVDNSNHSSTNLSIDRQHQVESKKTSNKNILPMSLKKNSSSIPINPTNTRNDVTNSAMRNTDISCTSTNKSLNVDDNKFDIDKPDELLMKAKLLIQQSASIKNQAQENSPNRISNNKVEIVKNLVNSPTLRTQEISTDFDTNDCYAFTCAAINGSSLITTYSDIRSYCKMGSRVFIDKNVCYIKAVGGEFGSNRISLSTDYSGETNLNALLQIPKVASNKFRYENIGPQPIPTENITIAVQALDSLVKDLSNKQKSSNISQTRIKTKIKKKQNPVIINDIVLQPISLIEDTNKSQLIQDQVEKTRNRIEEWNRKQEMKKYMDSIKHDERVKLIKKKEDYYHHLISNKSITKTNSLQNKVHEESKVQIQDLQEASSPSNSRIDTGNEDKVRLLQDITRKRVQNYKQQLLQQEIELKRQEEVKDLERLERQKQLVMKQQNLRLLKQETKLRLDQIRNQDVMRIQLEEKEKLKKLKELSERRGLNKPTASTWLCKELGSPSKSESSKMLNQQVRILKSAESPSKKLILPEIIRPSSEMFQRSVSLIPENSTQTLEDRNIQKMESYHEYEDDDNDVCSEDSLGQEDLPDEFQMNLQEYDLRMQSRLMNNSLGESIDGRSIISEMTLDDFSMKDSQFSNQHSNYTITRRYQIINQDMKSKTKPKKPVWKLKPIEVRPYIPIPTTSSSLV